MASRNSRTNRQAVRSSRAPQSARTVRSTRATTSGRSASSRDRQQPAGFRPAYTPSSRRSRTQDAYDRSTAANPYSRANANYSRKKRGLSRGKKVLIGVLSVLLVALIGCGTAFALYLNSVNQKLAGDKTEEEKEAIGDVLAPTVSFSEPFYLMLIGSDERADDEEMGARSDTNILTRVEPSTGTITMVSIPRDTRIDIDGYGTNKFNAAYNYGGVAGVIREASQLCEVNISHYAEVNFDELIQLVDAVGGVEVDVPERIDDPDAGPYIIEAGVQTLNGELALEFARSRAYFDGDFTRASNQRLLIEALISKVLSLPITELPGTIQSAAQCVTTDFSLTDLFSLATQFKNMDNLTIYSAMVPSMIDDTGSISYVVADTYSLREMMSIVEAGGDPNTVQTSSAIGSSLYANQGTAASTTGTTGTTGGSQ